MVKELDLIDFWSLKNGIVTLKAQFKQLSQGLPFNHFPILLEFHGSNSYVLMEKLKTLKTNLKLGTKMSLGARKKIRNQPKRRLLIG